MSNTILLSDHNCACPYQDERYGRRIRVWNMGKRDGSFRVYRCTVCGESFKKLEPEEKNKSA